MPARRLEAHGQGGGAPEPLAYDAPDLLVQLYDGILYREVTTRHDIKNTRAHAAARVWGRQRAYRPWVTGWLLQET